jgi:hypothetical protein
MGKQRITELLSQLESDRQKDLKNSAAIYAVAQVAVNQLAQSSQDPAAQNHLVPPAPLTLDKTELIQRHGSYNGCRKAAKALGIQFRTTPSWQQLAQAFSYAESLQQWVNLYLESYSTPALKGVTLSLRLSE